MSQRLVILRGTSCSGKSTLAEKLRDYDKKIAWLSIDNVKRIFSDFKDATLNLDDVNQTAVITIKDLLERDFSVLVDGIFKNPAHLHAIRTLGEEKNIPVIVYQLDCSLEGLKQRDKSRRGIIEGWLTPMGDDLIESLFRKVNENPVEGAIRIDTEKQTIEECLKTIKQGFE